MELALPSGSLESAYAAFKGGADAIYLGLNKFSARSRATNFTFEDLEKILSFSKANNKKVYVVLNTLIEDEKINEVYKLIKQLSLYPIDAVIVQDLGIVNLIKTNFPNIEIHGSTQLAVHSVDGVKFMKELGFTRVVLSRELSLSQIKEIREKCKDIEIKVFIHGAMCYGFSGLCTASAQLTNRSANKGECTQICRRYFKNSNDNSLFPFSMKDLDGTNAILELEKMKIDSLKIEGRMKSPNYCFKTARHYRYLLDNKKVNDKYYLEMITSFSRSSNSGYLFDKTDLIDSKYSEHKGILLSNEIRKNKNEISFRTNMALSNHDGLLLVEKVYNSIDKITKLSLQNFKTNNKRNVKANKNDIVSLIIKANISNIKNCSIYKISDSQSNQKYTSEKYPSIKYNVPTKIKFNENNIIMETTLFDKNIKLDTPITSEIANNKEAINSKLKKIFSTSSGILLSKVEVDSCFAYPLKEVKEIKRKWYELLNKSLEEYINLDYKDKNIKKIKNEILPKRSKLFNSNNHPWTKDGTYLEIDNKFFIILKPIIINEEKEKEILNNLYNDLIKRNKEIYIGLNNIAHINWVKSLDKAKIFIDWYLFSTNSESSKILSNINNFVGGYTYFEFKNNNTNNWKFTPSTIDDKAKIPYFISLACYRKNIIGKTCKDCNKDFEYFLTQNNKKYRISCDNCISITQEIN